MIELNNLTDLQNFTTTSYRQLNFLAFWKNTKFNQIYLKYEIPKRNNKLRVLHEPTLKLKIIQKKILREILEQYWLNHVQDNIKESSVWFHQWKSVLDNAKPHINKDVVIKIDLKNYFPSIGQNRIFGVFRKRFNCNYNISNYLAWLCTFENELPQWAPTSPMLANIVSINLDIRILRYIEEIEKNNSINLNYTRYADDITISFNSSKTFLIDCICNRMFDIIEDENFMVNYSKFRIIKKNRQQKITWIIVNDKLSIWRKDFKRMKAIVNNINNNSWESEYKKWLEYWNSSGSVENFKSRIKWYISYYNMVNECIYWKYFILNK